MLHVTLDHEHSWKIHSTYGYTESHRYGYILMVTLHSSYRQRSTNRMYLSIDMRYIHGVNVRLLLLFNLLSRLIAHLLGTILILHHIIALASDLLA